MTQECSKGLLLFNNLTEFILNIGPIIEQIIKFERRFRGLLFPYKQLQKAFQNKMKQTSLLISFKLSGGKSTDDIPYLSTSANSNIV